MFPILSTFFLIGVLIIAKRAKRAKQEMSTPLKEEPVSNRQLVFVSFSRDPNQKRLKLGERSGSSFAGRSLNDSIVALCLSFFSERDQ